MKESDIIIAAALFALPWLGAVWTGMQLKKEFSPTPEHPNRHFNSSAVGGALLYECTWVCLALFASLIGGIHTRSIIVAMAPLAGLIPAFLQRSYSMY
jgi:hypothetical protein